MSTDTINLSISGMTCNHCVASAKKALQAVAGVEGVIVSLEPGGAVITGSADKASLIAAINDAGYKAE
ncbi:MAG: cation transporter [gamma proteobacterium symbiont of Taylorina sp.]|nr:cation transporter [gamma proteobacterium symbiont of Taylorina sp.]